MEYVIVMRAVSACFARRAMKPFFLTTGAILALLYLGTIYLGAEVSGWWWLLLPPIFGFTIIWVVLLGLVRFLVQKLNPPQSPDQRAAVQKFTTKLNTAVSSLQTPRFLVFIYLVRDALTGSQYGFLQQVFGQSRTLKRDFEQLMTLFRPLP